MTTANATNGWGPGPLGSQLPTEDAVPLAAGATGGYGQALFFNASGYALRNDGATPGLICAGRITKQLAGDAGSQAGQFRCDVHQGIGTGQAASTVSLDGFDITDVCTVAFDAGDGVPGKLSHNGGSSRSILGIVFGLDDAGRPRLWCGPQAHAMARALLIAKNFPLASHEIADAAANTAVSERIVSFRPKVKGTVTDITYTGSALVVGDTDYVTISVAKRDGAGGSPVVLGTYDSRAAGNGAATAFVPKSFTLSVVAGALYLLESDVVTITTVKGNSGQVLTGEILVNGKAI